MDSKLNIGKLKLVIFNKTSVVFCAEFPVLIDKFTEMNTWKILITPEIKRVED